MDNTTKQTDSPSREAQESGVRHFAQQTQNTGKRKEGRGIGTTGPIDPIPMYTAQRFLPPNPVTQEVYSLGEKKITEGQIEAVDLEQGDE